MKAFKTFLLSSLTFIAVSIVLVTPFENNYVDVSAYTNGDASTYYNGIDASLPGNELLRDLRSLNVSLDWLLRCVEIAKSINDILITAILMIILVKLIQEQIMDKFLVFIQENP